ncbi:MAG: hypothetical protein ACOC9O_00910, partial [Myxococcota bacterium]
MTGPTHRRSRGGATAIALAAMLLAPAGGRAQDPSAELDGGPADPAPGANPYRTDAGSPRERAPA